MLKLYDLSINAVKNPAYAPSKDLYVGWKLDSDQSDVLQTSYKATITKVGCDTPDWVSEGGDKSIHISVDTALCTRTNYTLTVTVTDNKGESATASVNFFTDIAADEWAGVFIKPKRHIESWAPYLRTKFEAKSGVKEAKLFVCGLGCGEYYINGRKISEDLIDPPLTNYDREIFYRIYDVTSFIEEKNAFAALLGDGWYSQSRVWGMHGLKYGDVCLLAQLEITYENGEKQIIATNTEDWKYKYSPITVNNLHAGETYDCRLETPDFADYNGDEEEWGSVVDAGIPGGELKLCMMPPVRFIRSLKAQSVTSCSGVQDGAWIVDFGENVAGVVELKIPPTPRGAQIVLRFAETINPDGTLDYRSIGSFATQCIQQDIYIARGDAEGEIWRPRFTYHGFRYMEITGYTNFAAFGIDPALDIGVCHVMSTDLAETGSFKSACDDLNNLQTIMLSTFRSNYHGFPEDCPARERCGWLGDAQVACNYGMMNFDLEASYEKYIHDFRTTDESYGVWQMVSPGKRGCLEASPLWGCANVVMPYWMYHYYGNDHIVRSHWDQMEKWMKHEMDDAEKVSGDYILTRGLGDWCPPGGNYIPRRIPITESSTAVFFEIALMMDELAKALDLPTAVDYADLAERIKESFNRHFWIPELHRYSTWGACGVALNTGLYPDGEREALLKALLELMEADKYEMSVGIYTNKHLAPMLAEEGHGDEAMKYLFNRNFISFGTMLDDGATSLWEVLHMKMIGQPRAAVTDSYNHPMHSGFAYLFYAHIGGIKPLTPGFGTFEVKPCYFTDVPAATVSHVSPYGEIKVDFKREGSKTDYTVTVPTGAVGYFRAGGMNERMGSGVHTFTVEG